MKMKIKMNLQKKIRYLMLFALLFTGISCNDWLELLPPGGLIKEEFWKTKEDVEAVLMGAYDSFASMDELLFKYGEIRADLVQYDSNLGSDERNMMQSNIYPTNYLCDWSQFYKVINYANEVIHHAPLVQKIDDTFTPYQVESMMAEAYFLRSLAYFYLVRIFRDVPFITGPTLSDGTDFYVPKTDGDEILRILLEELKTHRSSATTDGYATLAELKGRATKAAYDALIADIALWLFDYNTCIEYADNIIGNKDYTLMPSTKWFEIFYPGNSLEGIFEFQFDDDLNQRNSMYGLTQRYAYLYDPSPKALEMFAADYAARELYRGENSSIKKYGTDDYIIWKYVGRAPDGYSIRSGSEQNSCNWIVYRYAEVLLMKAEALSQLERFDEAHELLTKIRDRADVSAISIANSKIAYEDAILEERALELAFEGKRWFDLLRMGRRDNYARKAALVEIIIRNVPSTQKRILATKLTNPLGWYMPIAESEIERNRELVQNPFYNY